MYVFDIAFLEDDVIERFRSDFKIVARFFKNRRINQDIADQTELKHIEAVLDLLSAFTDDQRYAEVIPAVLESAKKGKGANMCVVADALVKKGEDIGRQEGWEKGRKEGELNLAIKLIKKGKLTISDAVENAGITEEEMAKAIEAYTDEGR